MSATHLNNNQPNQLNEHHGIAASGLNNNPFTATVAPGAKPTNDDLNYSGPNISANKVHKLDQTGTNNTPAGINTTPGGQLNEHNNLATTNTDQLGQFNDQNRTHNAQFNDQNRIHNTDQFNDQNRIHNNQFNDQNRVHNNNQFNDQNRVRNTHGTNNNEFSTHQPVSDFVKTTSGKSNLDDLTRTHPSANQNTHDLNTTVPVATNNNNDLNKTTNMQHMDQAGTHNPSNTNRHAGTGIPPVNTAAHVQHNIEQEKRNDQHLNNRDNSDLNNSAGHIGHTGVHSNNNDNNNNIRHAGEPLHPGLGRQKHNHMENDATTKGQHPISSDGVEHTKPSAGDKIKGNLEKIAGKLTGNEAKVIKGENIATGRQ